MIAKQDIEQRIQQLAAEEQQHLADANACHGAISELAKLLKQWDAAPTAPGTPVVRGDNGKKPLGIAPQ